MLRPHLDERQHPLLLGVGDSALRRGEIKAVALAQVTGCIRTRSCAGS